MYQPDYLMFHVYFQLSDTQSSLVWSIEHDRAKSLMHLDDEQFVEEVNNAFVSKQNLSNQSILSMYLICSDILPVA